MVVNTSPIIGDQPNRHMPFQLWSILIILLLGRKCIRTNTDYLATTVTLPKTVEIALVSRRISPN